jgi:hypothetical protein
LIPRNFRALPEYDSSDITALLAANIVYQFISIIAAKNKQKLNPE